MFADVPDVIVRTEGLVEEAGHHLDLVLCREGDVVNPRQDLEELRPKVAFLVKLLLFLVNMRFDVL